MALRCFLGDEESEAEPRVRGLGRLPKTFEDVGDGLGRDARPLVVYREAHLALELGRRRANQASGGAEFDRVADQVGHYLAESHPIADDDTVGGRGNDLEPHPLSRRERPLFERVGEQGAERVPVELEGHPAGLQSRVVEDVRDELAHARRRPSEALGDAARLGVHRRRTLDGCEALGLQRDHCERHAIPSVDLLGPLLGALSGVLGVEPKHEPGAMHLKDEEYFRRMDAIDFAIKYDDGKSPSGLRQADLVITGVSRTSKTPTCMYLAQNQGIKAANMPLVPGAQPPKDLFELPPGRVIGLTLKPELLTQIRGSRLATLGLPPESAYADRAKIADELAFAEDIFRRLRCPVVDVTHKAIEETASEILEILQNQRKDQPA